MSFTVTCRQVRGLKWVRRAENPWPKVRHTQAQLSGLRFERAACKALGLRQGFWLEFEDQNGLGFCCADGLRAVGPGILVAECKLTDTPEAHQQLLDLYLPVLSHLLGRPIWPLVIVKNLTTASGFATGDPQRALELSLAGTPGLLHLPFPSRATFRGFDLRALAATPRVA